MKKYFNILLIIVVTIGVLYFSLKDNYEVVINSILNINKGYLLIAFLLLFSYWFFRSIVMLVLAQNFEKKYTIKDAFRMTVETNFFHAVTPFATGGQPYEVYSLTKSGLKLVDSTNTSISGFITYQIALVLLGTMAIIANYFFNFFPDNALLARLVTLGFIINFLVIVGLFVLTFTKKISDKIINFGLNVLSKLRIVKNKENKKIELEKSLKEFHDGAKLLLKDKFKFFLCVSTQLISLVSLYLIPFALISGLNLNFVNPIIVIITSAYVMLIGSFVPIPGGTGGLEYGFVAFFSNFFVGSKVNALMILWRFITYYFGMILGAIMLGIKKEKK